MKAPCRCTDASRAFAQTSPASERPRGSEAGVAAVQNSHRSWERSNQHSCHLGRARVSRAGRKHTRALRSPLESRHSRRHWGASWAPTHPPPVSSRSSWKVTQSMIASLHLGAPRPGTCTWARAAGFPTGRDDVPFVVVATLAPPAVGRRRLLSGRPAGSRGDAATPLTPATTAAPRRSAPARPPLGSPRPPSRWRAPQASRRVSARAWSDPGVRQHCCPCHLYITYGARRQSPCVPASGAYVRF